MRTRLLHLFQVVAIEALSLSARRAFLQQAAAAVVASGGAPTAFAAQRGAEDAYKTQSFDNSITCTKRTLLGACQEVGAATAGPSGDASPMQLSQRAPGSVRSLPVDPAGDITTDSEIVRKLLQRTADNAEANAREVKEKTIKANEGATFGPFAKDAPIMRADGNFDVVPLAKYDRLKNKGVLTKTKTGLDTYVAGFDPDAPEAPTKLFGIF